MLRNLATLSQERQSAQRDSNRVPCGNNPVQRRRKWVSKRSNKSRKRGGDASHIMRNISTERSDDNATAKAIAAEAFAALRDTRQVTPFSGRANGLSVEEAYRILPLVRRMYEAEGARPVGRKIGFTNRTIWAQYGVSAPIWGYVFDRSARDLAVG